MMANAHLLGNRQDCLEKDAVVLPHLVAADRLFGRLIGSQLVAGQRVPLPDPSCVERRDASAAPALGLEVGRHT